MFLLVLFPHSTSPQPQFSYQNPPSHPCRSFMDAPPSIAEASTTDAPPPPSFTYLYILHICTDIDMMITYMMIHMVLFYPSSVWCSSPYGVSPSLHRIVSVFHLTLLQA